MEQITISIVIPNYNHAHYLPEALNAALAQSYPAHEILIIDDASTDNSLTVIQEYIERYPNKIRLLQNDGNQGVVYTLNRGFREATGSHVILAAADDWINPKLLDEAQQLLKIYPEAGLWSSGSWIAYEEQPTKLIPARMSYPRRSKGFISPQQARDLMLSIDSWFMGNTVVYNRRCAIEAGGLDPELQSYTDNYLCRVLTAQYGCCFTPERLGTWRICKKSYANSFNAQPERQIKVLNYIKQLMQEKHAMLLGPKVIQRTCDRLNFNLARTIWAKNNWQVTPELTNLVPSYAIKILKQISNTQKLKKYLGPVILFGSMRPYDIIMQIKLTFNNVLSKLLNNLPA